MMTSRAEYRLLLRQDNADMRLSHYGYEIGLLPKERYDYVVHKKQLIDDEIRRLKSIVIGGSEKVNTELEKMGSTPLNNGTNLAELIRRSELDYGKVAVRLIGSYAIVCLGFALFAWILYTYRYMKAKPKLIKYNQNLKKLIEFYEREDGTRGSGRRNRRAK